MLRTDPGSLGSRCFSACWWSWELFSCNLLQHSPLWFWHLSAVLQVPGSPGSSQGLSCAHLLFHLSNICDCWPSPVWGSNPKVLFLLERFFPQVFSCMLLIWEFWHKSSLAHPAPGSGTAGLGRNALCHMGSPDPWRSLCPCPTALLTLARAREGLGDFRLWARAVTVMP